MFAYSAAIVAALSVIVQAKHCTNATISLDLEARTGIFNIDLPKTNLQATTFIQNLTQQGRNFTQTALSDYQTTSGTYQISTQLCAPENAKSTSIIQVLTHGIGFDKTYWDISYNDFNYSYVDAALESGYYTLSYDRLGIGKSSHGEPLNEIQAALEVAALAELTRLLRNGTFPHSSGKPFSKVVHVGHSFGSAQTYSLVNQYPEISDGIILTGFSMNSSFVGYFAAGAAFVQAATNQPFRLGNVTTAPFQALLGEYGAADLFAGLQTSPEMQPLNYPPGYLANANIGTTQYLFFLPNYFDPQILAVGENSKQPVTIGELLTLGSLTSENKFPGPVLVITGSNDLPYCGGDCLATGDSELPSIPAAVAKNFPRAQSNFTAIIHPNCGHGMNLNYNQTGFYHAINEHLRSIGLAP